MQMAVKDDIAVFLRTNGHIKRINFAFGAFKVYPSAYQKNVADAIASEEIKVKTTGASSAAAGATYDMNFDSLELSRAFSIASPSDQGFVVHECTHAHFDIQNSGVHSAHEDEAAAYLAEAVFLEAAGQPPISSAKIRVISHRLAKCVLGGIYWIPASDAAALTAEVAKHPHYATRAKYNSGGFNRSLIQKILR
jgi:hypothetical protein